MTRAAAESPAVSTIAAGMPFAEALAAGLLARFADDITALGSLRLLLPNRRAIRAMEAAFLRQGGGKPMILPAMRPLGEVDEDERALLGAAGGLTGLAGPGGDPDLPPAIPAMRRLAMLARQIMARSAAGGEQMAAPQAARLAAELARLMDQVETEGLDFAGLGALAPEELAHHWQVTLEFLEIVTGHWPRLLAEESVINPAARRVRLIGDLAESWAKSPPPGPVIAAGSTGSIPATAALLKVIARLPRGEVVLPDLDRDMPDDAWEAIGETHPQYMLKQLIRGMGVDRAEVGDWKTAGEFSKQAARLAPRMALLREALAPAERTENWRQLKNTFAARTKAEIRLVECPGLREEAGAIALMMRQTLETPGKSAALITPNRQLARRVKSELARWNIAIDDSAGTPLAITPPATFLRLLAQAIAAELAPVPLLALLKHPLTAAGRERGEFLASIRRLEKKLRQERQPDPGLNGLAALQKHGGKKNATLKELADRLRPLQKAAAVPETPLCGYLDTFLTAAEALAASGKEKGDARLWAGEDGEATRNFIAELRDAAPLFGKIDPASFPALLDSLMTGVVVRPRWGRHPRLAIWGAIEARLQHADLLILGGLNENSWPPAAADDPWMSRPMRRKFGLPAAERRIGQSAHDFIQAAGAAEIVLTRAEKIDGTPTVPSRWLLRLEALAGPLTGGAQPWLQWFTALDRAEAPVAASPPRPAPPVAARPRQLSVTRIEEWMRDPYALYAGRILALRPLKSVGRAPDAADRGTIIHQAIENYMKAGGGSLEVFLDKGRDAFGKALNQPLVRAFWWPRFAEIAGAFVAIQQSREGAFRSLGIEADGKMTIDCAGSAFVLTAKADRIDLRLEDGSLEIIDYKTGGIPSGKQIAAGFAPQLPLEAMMAEAGAFKGVAAAPVSSLQYWKLTGKDPAIELKWPRDLEVEEETRRARDGLMRLVTLFADAATPYLSNPRPAFTGYGDYDHLARVREWQDEDRPLVGGPPRKVDR